MRSSHTYQWIGFALRGMVIGLADLFPGVSGGTMALLTGVYPRFVAALASLRPALLLCLRGRIVQGVRSIDWLFLTALVCGASIAIVIFSGAVRWLLEHHKESTLAVFAGLVLYTGYSLIRRLSLRWQFVLLGIAGFVLAFFLRELVAHIAGDGAQLPLPLFALGGAVAIAAMILPGISGSLLLLLLGMYEPVIYAIDTLDIPVLAVFGAGVVAGLLLFAPGLQYSYHAFPQHTIAVLAGLTFGSVREPLGFGLHSDTVPVFGVILCLLIGLILGRSMDYVARRYS